MALAWRIIVCSSTVCHAGRGDDPGSFGFAVTVELFRRHGSGLLVRRIFR